MTQEELKELNNMSARIEKERSYLEHLTQKINKPTFPESNIAINIDGLYIENKFNGAELQFLLSFLKRYHLRKKEELSVLENKFNMLKIIDTNSE